MGAATRDALFTGAQRVDRLMREPDDHQTETSTAEEVKQTPLGEPSGNAANGPKHRHHTPREETTQHHSKTSTE